jgi:hypothetical protein
MTNLETTQREGKAATGSFIFSPGAWWYLYTALSIVVFSCS